MIKKILAAVAALMTAAMVFAATDVNTATQAELDAVKGIGPSLSARIVAARTTAPFKDWSDLVTRIKGIGDKNGAKLSAAGLTVNGSSKSGVPADAATVNNSGRASTRTTSTSTATGTAAATAPAATAAVVTSTKPSATAPTATATAATGTAASAPMSAADKKAARRAAREEKARTKAANAAGAASAASSTPAHK